MRRIPVDLYKKIAKMYDMEYEDIRSIINTAYKSLQQEMGHGVDPYIVLDGLGSFEVRLPKLFERMRYYDMKQQEAMKLKNKFNDILFYNNDKHYNRLRLIQLDIEVQMQRKYETRVRYYEIMAKKNKENNKEQESDN